MSLKKLRDDQVRWGIIGAGDVCERKSAPAMNRIPNSSIVAVMRRDPGKAADYARRHGIQKWYQDANQLIQDPEINAIYIATPPSSHLEYVLQVARSGKPVYVEKPMGLNYRECQQMIRACEEREVPLYVAYYRRALSNFLKVKEIVAQQRLGAIRAVEIKLLKNSNSDQNAESENWRVNPSISGGGHFVDLASHQFDFLDFVFGPVTQVMGMAENQAGLYQAEDIVTANFKFENNIIGYGIWCFTVPENIEEERMSIIGSLGKLSFSCFGNPDLILELNGKSPEILKFEYPFHIQQPFIESIVQDLLGTGGCPSTGYTAARTNWVMDQILRTG